MPWEKNELTGTERVKTSQNNEKRGKKKDDEQSATMLVVSVDKSSKFLSSYFTCFFYSLLNIFPLQKKSLNFLK